LTPQQSKRILEKKYKPKRTIAELIALASGKLDIKPKLICSGSRQQKDPKAGSLLAWLAVEEVGYPAAKVAKVLGISRVGVKKAAGRGIPLKKPGLLDEPLRCDPFIFSRLPRRFAPRHDQN
jgi:hypothetical protein